MTVRELINELNELVANEEITMDALVVNAEDDDIYSVIENAKENKIVIYF